MASQKIELEQIADDEFRVLKLTNRLEPTVGSTITKKEVKDFLKWDKKVNVVIVPAKGGVSPLQKT